ncbi:hypothetical protein GFB49_11530 [Epibacterium sp. SM1979]|uniref:Transcriptional regulator n=1 Tax=Tritonibacter litoralis TaxID=2662264 RepID=A0A843YK65_9RHOB|nr:hypothetical protein [Tritonibacter litoralis]MQQ09087.1 hypothetical protein [Tritonibacter litoralis]
MRNPSLLRFLAAVDEYTKTGALLMTVSGYDPAELAVAVRSAMELGFIEGTGEVHPSLRITDAGRDWAAEELAPFARLMAATSAIGRAA